MSRGTGTWAENGGHTEPDFSCPKCGRVIGSTAQGLPAELRCPDCKTLIWCRIRAESDVIFLRVVPGTDPDIPDMATVAQSLPLSGAIRGLIVNLYGLDRIDSSFLAGVLVLQRMVEAAGGKLILCELHAQVLALMKRLNLDGVLTIHISEQDAVNALRADRSD